VHLPQHGLARRAKAASSAARQSGLSRVLSVPTSRGHALPPVHHEAGVVGSAELPVDALRCALGADATAVHAEQVAPGAPPPGSRRRRCLPPNGTGGDGWRATLADGARPLDAPPFDVAFDAGDWARGADIWRLPSSHSARLPSITSHARRDADPGSARRTAPRPSAHSGHDAPATSRPAPSTTRSTALGWCSSNRSAPTPRSSSTMMGPTRVPLAVTHDR